VPRGDTQFEEVEPKSWIAQGKYCETEYSCFRNEPTKEEEEQTIKENCGFRWHMKIEEMSENKT
jgi:hypothetical protein